MENADHFLHFLSSQISFYQTHIGEWLQYSKVEISFQEENFFVSLELVNSQGGIKNEEIEKGFMSSIGGQSLNMIPMLHYNNETISDLEIENSVQNFASKEVSESVIKSYKR